MCFSEIFTGQSSPFCSTLTSQICLDRNTDGTVLGNVDLTVVALWQFSLKGQFVKIGLPCQMLLRANGGESNQSNQLLLTTLSAVSLAVWMGHDYQIFK